jgi:hypothetical protein
MLNFIRNHPYFVAFIIVFLILFFIGILALDASWSEALFGSAALAAIGVVGYWWKVEGLG